MVSQPPSTPPSTELLVTSRAAAEMSFAADLPSDLLEEILIRLPIKSLIRFSSACKSFHSLIQNPNFIADHAHRAQITSARTNDFSVVAMTRFSPTLNQYSVSDFAARFRENDINIPHPFLIRSVDNTDYNAIDVIGCCRGLVCLLCICTRSDNHQVVMCIWNPATRRIKVIAVDDDKCAIGNAGFGFHNRINDYTVVRFQQSLHRDDFIQLKVYSVSSGTWKISDKFFMKERGQFFYTSSVVCMNGVCYLIAHDFIGAQPTLMAYDVVMGTLNKDIKLPKPNDHSTLKILDLNEKLCLVGHPFKTEGMMEFWVMDESSQVSWTKRFSLNYRTYNIIPSFLFTKSGEVLWQENLSGTMVRIRKPGSDNDDDDDEAIKLPFSVPPNRHKLFLYEETLQSVCSNTRDR